MALLGANIPSQLTSGAGPRLIAGLLFFAPGASAFGQADQVKGPCRPAESGAARARFEPPAEEPDSTVPGGGQTDWALEIPSPAGLGLGQGINREAEPTAEAVERLMTEIWLLTSGSPARTLSSEQDLSRSLTLRDRAAVDPLRARTDGWATGPFSRDAELLTPLAPGQEILSWDLTDRLTLAGVGGSRVWDYRDREFVLSAEAGLRLSARAGLHFGYELFQASTVSMTPDLGGESVFARFQLRF